MDFEIGAAIAAGAVATVAMTVLMYMGKAMLPRQMPMNILYMLGSMVRSSTGPAYLIGTMMHAVNGIAFALIHTGLYQAFDLEEGLVGWGLLFGLGHWVVFGMAMGMMRFIHPMVRRGQLADPGLFLLRYPMMNVMGALMAHLVFGLVLGALYEAWR